VEELTRFAQYKQAPFVGLTRAVLKGKTAVGEDVTIPGAVARSVVPLVLQDVREAYIDAGWKAAVGTGGLAFFGVGVNTYAKSEARVRRDIRKAIFDDDFTEAKRLRIEWNATNRDNRISRDYIANARRAARSRQ